MVKSPHTILSMKLLNVLLSVCVLTFLLGSCDLTYCTLELEGRLDPRAATLVVGGSITPTVGLYTCGGKETVKDTFVWTSTNTHVASVERASGEITALAEGRAKIEVLAQETGFVQIVDITVVLTE